MELDGEREEAAAEMGATATIQKMQRAHNSRDLSLNGARIGLSLHEFAACQRL